MSVSLESGNVSILHLFLEECCHLQVTGGVGEDRERCVMPFVWLRFLCWYVLEFVKVFV